MKVTQGLVIFITGGASGLGEAAARRFHSEGASVAVADLNEKRMQALQDELRERILCIYCNVTKEEDVKQAVKQTVERYGAVHVALAAAGVMWPSPMLSSKGPLNTKSFEMLFRINVFGSAYVAKYAAIEMSKNKAADGDKGVILFVSSVAAEEGQRRTVAYSSSKGAIHGMILPMARDLGRYGIRVASIQPGLFDTPMTAGTDRERALPNLLKEVAIGRIGHTAEFSHLVKSIVENTYINGVHLRIDGGARLSHL